MRLLSYCEALLFGVISWFFGGDGPYFHPWTGIQAALKSLEMAYFLEFMPVRPSRALSRLLLVELSWNSSLFKLAY